jgi:hypothetical protein
VLNEANTKTSSVILWSELSLFDWHESENSGWSLVRLDLTVFRIADGPKGDHQDGPCFGPVPTHYSRPYCVIT